MSLPAIRWPEWLPRIGGTLLGDLIMVVTKTISWAASTKLSAPADGTLQATNAAGTAGFRINNYNDSFKNIQNYNGALSGWNALQYYCNGGPGWSSNGGMMRLGHWSGGDVGIELLECGTDLGVAATNCARLFLRDNGSGKTQLCVRFQTGSVIVLVTES